MARLKLGGTVSKDLADEIKTANSVTTDQELAQAIEDHTNAYEHSLSDGWKDNVSGLHFPVNVDIQHAPLLVKVPSNNIWSYCFADDHDTYSFADFHINHDYDINTLIYPHIHWYPLTVSTGNVRWRFDWVYAKGHNQGDTALVGGTTFFTVDQSGKGTIGEHMIAEASEAQAFSVPEVDGVIRTRIARLGTDPADTFYGAVSPFMVDLHYQSSQPTTKNKSPNFYE